MLIVYEGEKERVGGILSTNVCILTCPSSTR